MLIIYNNSLLINSVYKVIKFVVRKFVKYFSYIYIYIYLFIFVTYVIVLLSKVFNIIYISKSLNSVDLP